MKRSLLLANLSLANSKGFLFYGVERPSRSDVGFECSPYCLSRAASVALCCLLSASEQPLFFAAGFPIKELDIVHKYTNPSEKRSSAAYYNCLCTLPGVALKKDLEH